jgi:hypothetical protein
MLAVYTRRARTRSVARVEWPVEEAAKDVRSKKKEPLQVYLKGFKSRR